LLPQNPRTRFRTCQTSRQAPSSTPQTPHPTIASHTAPRSNLPRLDSRNQSATASAWPRPWPNRFTSTSTRHPRSCVALDFRAYGIDLQKHTRFGHTAGMQLSGNSFSKPPYEPTHENASAIPIRTVVTPRVLASIERDD
jgi:hypothetical protein